MDHDYQRHEPSRPMSTTFVSLAQSPARLVAFVCAAQVLVQIGAFFWPSLLPGMIPLWQLSNSEAGWITAGFYGAYMVSVPVHRLLHPHAGDERVTRLGRRLPWIRGAQYRCWRRG